MVKRGKLTDSEKTGFTIQRYRPNVGSTNLEVGQAGLTTTAFPITPLKTYSLGQASLETLAFFTTHTKGQTLGIASNETAGLSPTVAKDKALGLASLETAGFSVARGITKNVGIASNETAGFSPTIAKDKSIGQASLETAGFPITAVQGSTILFHDQFTGESSDVDLISHTPDQVGTGYAIANNGSLLLVTASTSIRSNNDAAENQYNCSTDLGTNTFVMYAHFVGADPGTGVCHWGVTFYSTDSTSQAQEFTYQGNHNRFQLSDGTTNTTLSISYPSTDLWVKLEAYSTTVTGYYSTDGAVSWSSAVGLSGDYSSQGTFAGIMLRDYSASQNPPECIEFRIETT